MRRRAIAAAALLAAIGAGVVALASGGDDEHSPARKHMRRPAEKPAPEAVSGDVVARAAAATIYISSGGFNRKVTGTGVLVDARRRLVLTNFHVVTLGSDIYAGTPRALHPAAIRAAAPCEDLALLSVEGLRRRHAIRLGRQDRLREGDPVVALGYPVTASGARPVRASRGVVTAARAPVRIRAPDQPGYPNLLQSDVNLAPGNSGGPLVGADGRLLGLNTIVLTAVGGDGAAGQGYAIGVDRVRKVLAYLRRGRSRAWFGAGLLTPPRRFLRRERLPAGILATGAQGGTSAAEFGLEDVLITGVDGRRVRRSLPSYCSAMRGHRSGDAVVLTVIRTAGGVEQTVRVRLD